MRSASVLVSAATLSIIMFMACVAPSASAVTTARITVGIQYVAALDPLDVGSAADMYWSVTVYNSAGTKVGGPFTSTTYNNQNIVNLRSSPWYTGTMTLPAGSGQTYSFVFDLNDKDLTGSDHLDTNGANTAKGDARIYFNIDTKVVWGDDGYSGDPTTLGCVNGGEDGSELPWGSDTDQDDGYFEYLILYNK
ncbi:MAG: hypothetical protein ACUVT7_05975 [Thermoplasmata archaeon]